MILIVRHGETDWNVQERVQGKADIPLNDKGREQAKATGELLKDEKIDIIISSPLKRAKETAEIINKNLNCKIIFDKNFEERDFGDFEGEKRTDFDFEGFWSYKRNLDYGKVESLKKLFNRVYETMERIKEEYIGKNVLIVSHGGISVPIECYFNGIPKDDILIRAGLGNCKVRKYEW